MNGIKIGDMIEVINLTSSDRKYNIKIGDRFVVTDIISLGTLKIYEVDVLNKIKYPLFSKQIKKVEI